MNKKLKNILIFITIPIVLLVGSLLLLPRAIGSVEGIGVRSVTIEGNTQYDEQAILKISEIYEGKSVFSINKGQAAKRLKEQLAYVQDAQITISFKRDVTIRITEAVELGAVYANGSWVVVDENGIGLKKLAVESERPLRRMYLKGVVPLTDQLGQPVLSERNLTIIREIRTGFEQYDLGFVSEIDMTNLTDIRVKWKNQIDIVLGNDSRLDYEIAVVAATIPKILARHGETATGRLNVSQYSDPSIKTPAIIFTPSELMD